MSRYRSVSVPASECAVLSPLLHQGREISYDYLVVAAGLQLRYDMVGVISSVGSRGNLSEYAHLAAILF